MSNDNDLEKELLKAKLEIQRELIKKKGRSNFKSDNKIPSLHKKTTKSIDELRNSDRSSKKSIKKVDVRLIKTPLDLFLYNYDFESLLKCDDSSTPYLKFLNFLLLKKYKEAKSILDILPQTEEKSFDEFCLIFFSKPSLAIQVLAQKSGDLGKYKDIATFMIMAYLVKDFNLVKKLSEQISTSFLPTELKFLASLHSYLTKDNTMEIIPSVVVSLRKLQKNKMLNNLIGYVNLKKGDFEAAKAYFTKSIPFTCSCANLEEMNKDQEIKNCFCPKILYLRIKKMISSSNFEAAKKMFENFSFEHPYKFLSYYLIYGSNESNDSALLKFLPVAKFYFKTRLLAVVNLKSLSVIDSYRKALSEKLNLSAQNDIRVEIDVDNYEFFYQLLGGMYCAFNK